MNIFSPDKIKSSNNFLLSLLILSLSISLIIGLGFIKYFGYSILLFWLLLNSRSVPVIIKSSRFLQLFLIFSLWCILSSLWSISPLITFLRSGFQLFLIFSIALIIRKVNLNYNHFSYSVYLVTFLVGVSLIFALPADSWTGGNAKGFMGAFHHQNSLGAIILFLLPILNFYLFENYKKLHAAKLSFLISISLFLFITLFLTASRSAILSYLIFLSIFFSFINIRKTAIAIFILMNIISLSLVFQPTSVYFKDLVYKGRTHFGESRFLVYNSSLHSAKNGGVIGFGFGMSDPDNILTEIGTTKNGFYQREKGSTALALIEETGVIGFILYFIAIAYLLCQILNEILTLRYKILISPEEFISGRNKKIFLFAIIIVLIIHQQFEAYGAAPGSQFYALFLLILFSANNEMT